MSQKSLGTELPKALLDSGAQMGCSGSIVPCPASVFCAVPPIGGLGAEHALGLCLSALTCSVAGRLGRMAGISKRLPWPVGGNGRHWREKSEGRLGPTLPVPVHRPSS